MAAHNLYWGDIHNHNEIGKGLGTLARSYDIARSHLDFYAFTPHTRQGENIDSPTNQIVIENWSALQIAAAHELAQLGRQVREQHVLERGHVGLAPGGRHWTSSEKALGCDDVEGLGRCPDPCPGHLDVGRRRQCVPWNRAG